MSKLLSDDPQEQFNIAVRGIAAQGWKQSVNAEGDTCRYRGEDGMKCAVGHLIPDEFYQGRFDARTVPVDDVLDELGVNDGASVAFLKELQMAHDCPDNEVCMRRRLQRFAAAFDLTTPEDVNIDGDDK